MMAVTVMRMPFMGGHDVVVAMMGAVLRPEAALDRRGGAALAARQFGEGRAVLDIEGIAGKFGEAVLAAEMPGETHEAKRVLGASPPAASRRPP